MLTTHRPPEAINRQLQSMLGRPCLLCGARATAAGLFRAEEQEVDSARKRWNKPEGTGMVAVYGICTDCQTLPDLREMVETFFEMDLKSSVEPIWLGRSPF